MEIALTVCCKYLLPPESSPLRVTGDVYWMSSEQNFSAQDPFSYTQAPISFDLARADIKILKWIISGHSLPALHVNGAKIYDLERLITITSEYEEHEGCKTVEDHHVVINSIIMIGLPSFALFYGGYYLFTMAIIFPFS
jgi:hypothetical protein